MLYLDYGRRDGEWLPNIYGGNGNLAAIEFFKHLNSIIRKREDGTVIIAEESTAWPDITKSPDEGGLGFHFKWNMGWMHDFLSYMKEDPMYRNYHHNQLTFGMSYAYSEKFILVLSHDEVVHLKRSMIEKMPGSREQKFRNLKAAYFFMIGHAGKKLLFMGQDFGQYREWNEDCSIDWHLLEEKENRSLHSFLRDLLQLYKTYPALYEADYLYEGFSWVNADDASRSIYSFIRNPKNHLSLSGKPGVQNGALAAVAEEGNIVENGNIALEGGKGASAANPKEHRESLLFVVNMTPMDHEEYWVGMPKAKEARLILTEEGLCKEEKYYPVVKGECDGRDYHIAYPLKGFGCALFAFTEETEDSCANALSSGKEENLQVSEEKPEGQQEKKESSKVAEKTAEETAEKAVEKIAEKNAEKTAEKTIEKNAEKTAEKTIEKNAEKIAEKNAEKTAEYFSEVRVREEAG